MPLGGEGPGRLCVLDLDPENPVSHSSAIYPVKLSHETALWSRRYHAALRRLLEHGPEAGPQPALGLGRQAVALGMETLDVARVHEQALRTLLSAGASSMSRQRRIARAKRFFAETVAPIEKTHPAALKAAVRAAQLGQSLRKRTAELSVSRRRLKRAIMRRQESEAALEESRKDRARVVQESSRLQNCLRYQTRKILWAQEEERKKTSGKLHEEVTQALVAIRIELLTLNGAAQANTGDLRKEIFRTQKLVRESTKAISR